MEKGELDAYVVAYYFVVETNFENKELEEEACKLGVDVD